MATIAASVGFALAAAVDTTWSSRRKSGGNPPAPACKTLKNTVIVSTASFGAFGWPWSSPVALARRNRRHAEEKGAPAAAARSCSHFSRFKYSRRAANAASSTANACGARSSTVVSALRSWHASSIRATHAPPSRACASAIARTTHSRPAGPDVHTPCRTRAALGCPPASRNDLSVATATSARNPPALLASSAIAAARPSAITSSHPFARTAGITRVPLVAAASVGASAGGVASTIAASERYRSMLFQHWFALPKGAAPSRGGSFRREDGHGKRGDATAQQRRSSWPLGERRHAEPSHTASIGKGTLSIVARSNISIRASNESLFGHEKPSWSRCAIAALQSRRGAAAASASTTTSRFHVVRLSAAGGGGPAPVAAHSDRSASAHDETFRELRVRAIAPTSLASSPSSIAPRRCWPRTSWKNSFEAEHPYPTSSITRQGAPSSPSTRGSVSDSRRMRCMMDARDRGEIAPSEAR